MSALSLTKLYADSTLLFASDVHDMWVELEAKTNGTLEDSNLVSGWATWGNVTLSKDTDFSFGTTSSAYMRYDTTDSDLEFSNVTTARDFLFKIGGTTVGTLDTSKELILTKDVFFANKSTTYPLSYLAGYTKPVLVYADSNTVTLEQNTTTASSSLIIFPSGPIAVTENTGASHQFRSLKLDAVANGYDATHTGSADSGLKEGLSLVDNTWYYVYAAVVRYGSDAGNNYIMVVDSVSPTPSNWATHDGSYGAGKWVYLGMLRIGHGTNQADVLVPFYYDKSGWLTFTGRATADDFFGIKIADATINTTTYYTIETLTAGGSGDAAPSTCSHINLTIRPVENGADMNGTMIITDSSDNVLWDLPSFGVNLADTDAHGIQCKVPNTGIKLKGKTGA